MNVDDVRMPFRRWIDFPAGMRRVRVANGLTQAQLSDLLGVEQATVSRWERGTQKPDTQTQDRIRDLLFHGRTTRDAILFHYVRSAGGGRLMFSREGLIIAASRAAGGQLVEGVPTARFRTQASQEAWDRAEAAGFFNGDVASIQFATELMAPGGIPLLVQFSWYPARMTDGTTHILADVDVLDETRFQAVKAEGLRMTLLDEIL